MGAFIHAYVEQSLVHCPEECSEHAQRGDIVTERKEPFSPNGFFKPATMAKIALETAESAATTRRLQEDMARNVEGTKALQEQMTEHLSVVARVQRMLEWLEVFVVSVAAGFSPSGE